MYTYAAQLSDQDYNTRCFGNYGQELYTTASCKRKDAYDKAKAFITQLQTGKWCSEHAYEASELLYNITNTFLDNYKGKTYRLVKRDGEVYRTDGHAWIIKTDDIGSNGDRQWIEVEFYESNAHQRELSVRIKLYGQCKRSYLFSDIASCTYSDIMDTWLTPSPDPESVDGTKKRIADFARNISA
jgi:hypothetical protein